MNDHYRSYRRSEIHRRKFLQWMGLSTLTLAATTSGCYIQTSKNAPVTLSEGDIKNIFDLEALAGEVMGADPLSYLNGGADDMNTVRANVEAFRKIQIRARRLIDVTAVSTRINVFGKRLESPIILCPVGFQQYFHPDGEVATAKAATNLDHQMFVSSVSNFSITEIARQSRADLWFQLYPTENREVTKGLLKKAEEAGCDLVALTIDTPVIGNRERGGTTLVRMLESGEIRIGNYEGLPEFEAITDPSLTWDFVDWLRDHTGMKIVLKGIVTREDAGLALEKEVDGIIVSNHGGRQLESNRATIDCLPEVVAEVGGEIPVLIDGGIRRGTDIFKALALGADAICIGRAFCWGLGAMGQRGVEIALEILQAELVRDMQLAGTTSIDEISRDYVLWKE